MKKLFILLLVFSYTYPASAQGLNVYEKKLFINGKDTLRYRILYPENYRKRKAYPLIVFLHGSGERGRDNEAQLLHGGDMFISERNRKNFKAIVLFPQCPKDSVWSRFARNGSTNERRYLHAEPPPVPQILVKKLMDSLTENRIVDKKKVYLGGLSLGGYGTYDMMMRYPDYFAAAFPICGATDIPHFLETAPGIPIWIFHGALDKIVPPNSDRELFMALRTRNVKSVFYTEYPEAGHNSWDAAFAEPKLLPWLFMQKNKKR